MHPDKELLRLLEESVDVRHLIKRLTFNIDDLESAAVRQPRLRLEAGRLKGQMALRQSSLKRRLSKIIGKKSIRARAFNETKVTEGAVKNKLSLDHEVQSAQKKFDQSEAAYEVVNQLVEAYKDRSMMISVLTRLRSAEMNSQIAAAKGESEMEPMRKKARKIQKEFEELD